MKEGIGNSIVFGWVVFPHKSKYAMLAVILKLIDLVTN